MLVKNYDENVKKIHKCDKCEIRREKKQKVKAPKKKWQCTGCTNDLMIKYNGCSGQIRCDTCKKWWHQGCAGWERFDFDKYVAMSSKEFESLKDNDVDYECPNCTEYIPLY